MKALTVCQPYAHLIWLGLKPIENRVWETKYRGTLLIHAGKSRMWMDDEDLKRYPAMEFGAIIAKVDLIDCVHINRLPSEYKENEHANGPWCWLLSNVKKLRPIPCNGKQGLWEFNLDVVVL